MATTVSPAVNGNLVDVVNPFSGEIVRTLSLLAEDEIERRVEACRDASDVMRTIPSFRRSELLFELRDSVRSRREQFATLISTEAGKPITDARTETDRAIQVLGISAEEAKRIGGELIPLDLQASTEGRFGITRRFPIGTLLAITPFNFPLNLGLHKVGPAIAAGNSVLWKPSLLAPGAAILFSELFKEIAPNHGIPAEALTMIFVDDSAAQSLLDDARVAMLSFTGSAAVGWKLRAKAGTKRVSLELGGNAAVIIGADSDIDYAVQRCTASGFGYAGQTCISAQRISIERPLYDTFVAKLIESVQSISIGDPLLETTRMGPVIREKEAERIERWLHEAVEGGAKILTGGRRTGLIFEPTIVSDAAPEMNVSSSEIFGPVVTVAPFDTWDQAIEMANRTCYGLQAGIFTHDMGRVLQAFARLDVGGLIVGDVPSFRVDSMPYGGIKESGLGREGVRFAIEDMTELKLMVLDMRGA